MKKVPFTGRRPTAEQSLSVDDWVANREGGTSEQAAVKMKRLTIDLPPSLHRRIKSHCAIEGLVMADVIRDLLEQRFPVPLPQSVSS